MADFDTVIIIGREQPAALDVERTARAIWGNAPEVVLTLPGEYTRKGRRHDLRTGEAGPVIIQEHVDPRVQRVLELCRERQMGQGLDRLRSEFEGEFGGNKVEGLSVLNGDKGWRRFGDNSMPLDDEMLAREKRNLYIQLTPVLLVPLKGKGFKLDSAADEKVGDKPAAVVKVTGPDGKDFTICFDKESGLPVKTVATVVGFMNDEYKQETTLSEYKDFGGIKKSTKSSSKRDGEKFIESEVLEFKALDKAPADAFNEP